MKLRLRSPTHRMWIKPAWYLMSICSEVQCGTFTQSYPTQSICLTPSQHSNSATWKVYGYSLDYKFHVYAYGHEQCGIREWFGISRLHLLEIPKCFTTCHELPILVLIDEHGPIWILETISVHLVET